MGWLEPCVTDCSCLRARIDAPLWAHVKDACAANDGSLKENFPYL